MDKIELKNVTKNDVEEKAKELNADSWYFDEKERKGTIIINRYKDVIL